MQVDLNYKALQGYGLTPFDVVNAITAWTFVLFPFLGQDFFLAVDAGAFDMHVRMISGTRIEEPARSVDQIE